MANGNEENWWSGANQQTGGFSLSYSIYLQEWGTGGGEVEETKEVEGEKAIT